MTPLSRSRGFSASAELLVPLGYGQTNSVTDAANRNTHAGLLSAWVVSVNHRPLKIRTDGVDFIFFFCGSSEILAANRNIPVQSTGVLFTKGRTPEILPMLGVQSTYAGVGLLCSQSASCVS